MIVIPFFIILIMLVGVITGITLLIKLFFFSKTKTTKGKLILLFCSLSGLATPFLLIVIFIMLSVLPYGNVILDNVLGTHSTAPHSRFFDAVTNDKGETKWVYDADEEIFGAGISIKIKDYGKFAELSTPDQDLLIKNTSENNWPSFANREIDANSLCYIKYRNTYNGRSDGNEVGIFVSTSPEYIHKSSQSSDLIVANTSLQSTTNNQSPFTKYTIFRCDTDQLSNYRIGFNPCHIRDGCLSNSEFMIEDRDSWRVNKKVYSNFAKYRQPVEFEVKI